MKRVWEGRQRLPEAVKRGWEGRQRLPDVGKRGWEGRQRLPEAGKRERQEGKKGRQARKREREGWQQALLQAALSVAVAGVLAVASVAHTGQQALYRQSPGCGGRRPSWS